MSSGTYQTICITFSLSTDVNVSVNSPIRPPTILHNPIILRISHQQHSVTDFWITRTTIYLICWRIVLLPTFRTDNDIQWRLVEWLNQLLIGQLITGISISQYIYYGSRIAYTLMLIVEIVWVSGLWWCSNFQNSYHCLLQRTCYAWISLCALNQKLFRHV